MDQIVKYWIDSSQQNYNTMNNLLKSKDYSWALFIGHLVLEKLLKAHYVKKKQTHAFYTHDLLRLSRKMDLMMPDDYVEWLDEISTFNLNARYDNYKQNFYRRCTKEFTMEWIERIEIIRAWLIQQL